MHSSHVLTQREKQNGFNPFNPTMATVIKILKLVHGNKLLQKQTIPRSEMPQTSDEHTQITSGNIL
jgi:hypothetical protein